jgi:hypothetical protein
MIFGHDVDQSVRTTLNETEITNSTHPPLSYGHVKI